MPENLESASLEPYICMNKQDGHTMKHEILYMGIATGGIIKSMLLLLLGIGKKDENMIINEVEQLYAKYPQIKRNPTITGTLRWVVFDGFKLQHFIRTEPVLLLEKTKKEFLDFYFSKIVDEKGLKYNYEIESKIDSYKLKILRLRLIIEPEFSITVNKHVVSGIKYVFVKGFWIDDEGVKKRNITKSLGKYEDFNNDIKNEKVKQIGIDALRKILMEKFKEEYKDCN